MQPASNVDVDSDCDDSVNAQADEVQIVTVVLGRSTRFNTKRSTSIQYATQLTSRLSEVRDREPPTDRRSRTDMYSKRSANLPKNVQEL